jgi:hypothetical protein
VGRKASTILAYLRGLESQKISGGGRSAFRDFLFYRTPIAAKVFPQGMRNVSVRGRQNLTELSRFGGGGRQAGEFHWPHMVSVDSEGNVYVGEVDGAARTQKFLRYGATGCSGIGNPEVGKYLE